MSDVLASHAYMEKLDALGKKNLAGNPLTTEDLDALFRISLASTNTLRMQGGEDSGKVNFTLDEEIKAVSQVRLSKAILKAPPVATGALLGKRYNRNGKSHNRGGIKLHTRCRASHEYGHWWKDSPDCVEKIREKQAAYAAEG